MTAGSHDRLDRQMAGRIGFDGLRAVHQADVAEYVKDSLGCVLNYEFDFPNIKSHHLIGAACIFVPRRIFQSQKRFGPETPFVPEG